MPTPRHFPSEWRERLDGHAELGWLNADERELLEGIVRNGDAWGLTRAEAEGFLSRHRPLPPELPDSFEVLRKRAELARTRGVDLEAAEDLLKQEAADQAAPAGEAGEDDRRRRTGEDDRRRDGRTR